ncbi:MAG: hypothetical protein IPK73_22855 [Candidatus Obscuribacter sp.]|nr:hypothetical protein [Candidatus Obscuribacter sp.]MBK9276953.1 hypothetical protein [Candidatus Obscuribacter sp.]
MLELAALVESAGLLVEPVVLVEPVESVVLLVEPVALVEWPVPEVLVA